MVSVAEATDIIFSNLYVPKIETVELREAFHRVLAERIVADRDFPPFDRVSMDGIAINFEQWEKGKREFQIEATQAAGNPRKRLQNSENCLEAMTGAMLPTGTDTVVKYEELDVKNGIATLLSDRAEKWQNVHKKGIDCKKEDVLLEPGILLSPAEIALLASVGKTQVSVYAMPKTAIISSGDELVDVKETPKAHQIRRSNTYAIEAGMQSLHWNGAQFHFPDKKNVLKKSLKEVIDNHEVLILSGGVSKGKFDFIPEVFEELGVKKLFHQVSQRPGKPFWFGVSKEGKIIFALPGNPVSTYMCFYRYIKPWILTSLNVDSALLTVVLGQNFSFTPSLTYFLQVEVRSENGELIAYPEAGGGSGDFVNLKNVTGFIELPADKTSFQAGDVFAYFPFRNFS
jgi:molybdopterin molybdotransferase